MSQHTQNPFADAFKAFGDFSAFNTKYQAFDVNALVTAQRRNAETLSAVNQVITETMQALFRRQAEIIQNNTSDFIQLVKDVTTAPNPENATAHVTASVKNKLEEALEHTKDTSEVLSKAGNAVLKVCGNHISENFAHVQKATKKAA